MRFRAASRITEFIQRFPQATKAYLHLHLYRRVGTSGPKKSKSHGLPPLAARPIDVDPGKSRFSLCVGIARYALIVSFGLANLPMQVIHGQADAQAEHTVWVGPSARKSTEASWEAEQPISVFTGSIKQFDAQELVLLDASSGQLTRIESSRIDRVEFDWPTQDARRFAELVSQHEYEQAVRALDAALKSGVPRWQQRFLVAAAVRCLDAIDSQSSAGILFLNLAATDPPPMLYADIPLAWTARETPAAVASKATEWLASSQETAQLLAASWLLFGANGEAAQAALEKLRASSNPTVAVLAQVQYWRTVPPPQTLQRLPEWLELIETLPQPLRIGPTEFVADRLMRIGETDLAIGYWVRIASLHPERYHRAALALKTAQELLKRNNRQDEAERLTPWIEELSPP